MSRTAITSSNLRAYLMRDWESARRNKRAHWEARFRKGGLGEILRVSDELRRWMIERSPEWPTQREREEDLETHRRVAQALAKTAPVPTAKRDGARSRTRRIR